MTCVVLSEGIFHLHPPKTGILSDFKSDHRIGWCQAVFHLFYNSDIRIGFIPFYLKDAPSCLFICPINTTAQSKASAQVESLLISFLALVAI